MFSTCSCCSKVFHAIDTFRCIHEECNVILCGPCIPAHAQFAHSEPTARTCFDPECEGCWDCCDLSEEEYNQPDRYSEDPMGCDVENGPRYG